MSADGDSQKGGLVYVDYGKYLSTSARRRHPPELRKLAEYTFRDGYIKLGGGFPNTLTFPVVEADFKLRDGSVLHVDERLMMKNLQYGMSEGYPDLRQCLIDLQRRVHSPPTCDPQHPGQFDLVMTQGANDGINMAFNILLNEEDWALTEEATYSTALSMTASIGANVYPIAADEDGMLPKELDRALSSWDQLHPGCRKPKIIYTITSAGNPTGVTWSLGRKRAVYELARSHDLIILEDDAYYFLQFNRVGKPTVQQSA